MNTQPIEKVVEQSRTIDVQGEPWLTIQGEGIFAGQRAVFIRLAGCTLNCELCDSDYTSDRHDWDVGELFQRVLDFNTKLVVITGGEPFRQPIRTLTDLLLFKGRSVQIETNGGLYQELSYYHGKLYVICSPKSRYVNEKLLPFINAWKYVVQHGNMNERGLPISTLGRTDPVFQPPLHHPAPIYVQPLDEKDLERNELNLQAAVQSVLDHDYILSIQTQKIAGLP